MSKPRKCGKCGQPGHNSKTRHANDMLDIESAEDGAPDARVENRFVIDDHVSEPASEGQEPHSAEPPVNPVNGVEAPISPFLNLDNPKKEISWTVGKLKQQDVTPAWFAQTKAWMVIHAVMCVMNLERGDAANNLHIQGVSTHHLLEEDLPKLIDSYKRFIPAGRYAYVIHSMRCTCPYTLD